MAYFSNGSEGMVFDDQCGKCKYGKSPCPIAFVQLTYNYDAVNNPTASAILECLVGDDGICHMYEMDPLSFFKDTKQTELELFGE